MSACHIVDVSDKDVSKIIHTCTGAEGQNAMKQALGFFDIMSTFFVKYKASKETLVKITMFHMV